MALLPVFLRREPSTDPVLRQYAPGARRFDVVAYKAPPDTGAKPWARWSWYQRRPRRGCKRVTLNCFNWAAVWLPTLEG